MKLVRWKRFTWDLAKLPPPPPLAERYNVRPAFGEDRAGVTHIIISAFTLDSAWGDVCATVKEWMQAQIDAAFERESAAAVVITHGQRVIAACAVNTEVEAETHLLSGPCVSMEYRNRGLGTALLYHTLLHLKQAGLTHVHGITKVNVPAAKFVYPKFGAVAVEYEFEPALIRT
jgi:N-acetylglutamate synthase-like GNAT family acetyltransferase